MKKLKLNKQTITVLDMNKLVGGAEGHSKANDVSCGATCFVKSCGCPKSVNGNCGM